MPSDMAAKRSHEEVTSMDFAGALYASPNSLLSALPKWAFRERRNADHVAWYDALTTALERYGITKSALQEPLPSSALIARRYPHSSLADRNQILIEETRAYLRENSAIFDFVRDSLLFKGSDEQNQADLAELRTLQSGDCRDGRGLLLFLEKWTSVSGAERQGKLILQVESLALAPGASIAQIENHSLKLWRLWNLIETNNKDVPAPFYNRWLLSLPTKPVGSPLSLTRAWLATRVIELVRRAHSAPRGRHPPVA